MYRLVRFRGGRDAQRDIVTVVDRMIVTNIAKIRAWEPEMHDELLEEEGGVEDGLGDLDDYIECLQHFVQVAGSNHAPNGGGVLPLGEDEVVCAVFQSSLHIAQGAATAVIAASCTSLSFDLYINESARLNSLLAPRYTCTGTHSHAHSRPKSEALRCREEVTCEASE